jgi:hypothetical protein
MTISRPSPSAFQLSSALLPELQERQQRGSEELAPLASVLVEVSVRQAALLWRRLNRQAQSPCHRQRWLRLVLEVSRQDSPVVLIPVFQLQVLEVQDGLPRQAFALQALVFPPLVWLAIFRTAFVSPMTLQVERLTSLQQLAF